MPKKIDLSIKESSETLQRMYRGATTELRRDRLKMLYYIKTGKYIHASHIADKLGRRTNTICDWIGLYRNGGLSRLLQIKSGGNNTPHISVRAMDYIESRLSDSKTTVTSYLELRAMIAEDLLEDVNYGALYAHCRRKHRSKLKVARKSHYKKDPSAEAFFKNPEISI